MTCIVCLRYMILLLSFIKRYKKCTSVFFNQQMVYFLLNEPPVNVEMEKIPISSTDDKIFNVRKYRGSMNFRKLQRIASFFKFALHKCISYPLVFISCLISDF